MTIPRHPLINALALLALAACATPTVAPGAGAAAPREMRIVWHRTDTAWADEVREFGGKINTDTTAFYRVINGVCHVWAPDPPLEPGRRYRANQWASLGHEIKHCFDGAFHS